METIRQNGKTILYSNDGISIKMVFKNLTGRNFQDDVTLSVKAWDEQGEIGHGTHKRSIVLKQTVLDKAEERTKLLMVRQANKQIEEMRR